MTLTEGSRLGPYEILSAIGAGGMGVVYKARDTRLDRLVAIKVSQAQFSDRFECEARAISALNHPHICQLYDVGPNYLAMELVEDAPLKGPLPIDQALKYGAQRPSTSKGARPTGEPISFRSAACSTSRSPARTGHACGNRTHRQAVPRERYVAPDEKLMAVPVRLGANFEYDTPLALFPTNTRINPVNLNTGFSYSVSGDGQRFLVACTIDDAVQRPVTS